jgi:glycosyltransferase involved in cell wall biosynthesis
MISNPDLERYHKIKLLGVDFEAPFDVRTFSGSSFHIWTELKSRGLLIDAFTPRPSAAAVGYYKLRSFRPSMIKWKANWHRSVGFRRCLSALARKRIERMPAKSFNSVLQIGAYYNISGAWQGYRSLLADNNCAISQATNVNFKSSEKAFRKQYLFEKDVYDSMDRIFCFSGYLAGSFARDFGCPESKLTVVYAGINIDEKQISTDGKQYDSHTVLFSAFDFENKGGQILLDAFEQVRSAVPQAKLVLLGPTKRNLPAYVVNHGPLLKSNPDDLALIAKSYREASVFVLPTLADAFPNVVREAMAARLPCVATDLCGIPEMVEDGRTGYLIPKGDAQALAERLIYLLKNPDLCRDMGQAGYRRYREHFTWPKVCDVICNQIADALADGK